MKTVRWLITVLLLALATSSCWQMATAVTPKPHRPEIDPYITFLRSQKQPPVDYLLGLLDRYDIVIISERYHAETTQYDLYYQLVSDRRFIDRVSAIFLETGTSNLQPEMDELVLSKTDLKPEQVEQRLKHIGQNIGHTVFWEKTNYYDFIKQLCQLNRTLPEEKKLRIYPSDIPFTWDGMTAAAFRELMFDKIDDRDQVIASQVIRNFDRLRRSADSRKKALVIMNYRHGFNNAALPDGTKQDDVGRYIMDLYPKITANVMMNNVASLPGNGDHASSVTPVQDGKWDAAFEAMGNPALGFDFKGTPFRQRCL